MNARFLQIIDPWAIQSNSVSGRATDACHKRTQPGMRLITGNPVNINIGNLNNNQVRAEAVAAGIGNSVVVNKNTVSHHHHNGGRKGSGSGEDSNPAPLFGLLALLVLALAATGWFFAQWADVIYAILICMAGGQALLTGSAVVIPAWKGHEMERPMQDMGTFAISGLLACMTAFAWASFPEALTPIASAAPTMKGFWCSLNSQGQTLSSQHVLAALSLVVGNLAILPQSARAGTEFLAGPTSTLNRWSSMMSSAGNLVVGALMGAATWAFIEVAGGQLERFVDSTRFVLCK